MGNINGAGVKVHVSSMADPNSVLGCQPWSLPEHYWVCPGNTWHNGTLQLNCQPN